MNSGLSLVRSPASAVGPWARAASSISCGGARQVRGCQVRRTQRKEVPSAYADFHASMLRCQRRGGVSTPAPTLTLPRNEQDEHFKKLGLTSLVRILARSSCSRGSCSPYAACRGVRERRGRRAGARLDAGADRQTAGRNKQAQRRTAALERSRLSVSEGMTPAPWERLPRE